MKQFDVLQFPEVASMRQRARRRELATMAALAAGALLAVTAVILTIQFASMIFEPIQSWVLSIIPDFKPFRPR